MKRPGDGLGYFRWINSIRKKGDAPSTGHLPRLHKNATERPKVSYAGQIPKILFAAALIFFAGGISMVVLWESRDRGGKKVFTLPLRDATSIVIKVPVPEREALEDTVRSFLAARAAAELEPLIRGSGLRPEQMIAMLAELEKNDGKIASIRYHKPVDSRCLQVEAVLVNFATGHNRLALLSPDGDGNWRVDFDAFARHVTPDLDQFLTGEPLDGTLRVYVSADNYYNGRYTEDNWACFTLASPDEDTLLFGYTKRGSRQFAAILSTLRRNGQGTSVPMQRMTLEVRHTGTGDRRQFEITQVLADDWSLGSQPLEALMPGTYKE